MLPFSSGHPDLAATYLANNLSCLLRQQDEDDLVIYVESLRSDQPGLRTLLSLVGNNLSRYREVRVTDHRKEAHFFLRGEAYEIQSGLYQVWVVLHPKNSGEHLSGMDTATYLRIRTAGSGPVPVRLAKTVPVAKPAIAELELVRRHGSDGCTQKGGAHSVAACPVLELTVEGAERVFVFVHGPKDGISRLSSGNCDNSDAAAAKSWVTHNYRFPAARFADSDWATVYAIAVSGPETGRQFSAHMQVLPDACGQAAGMHADSTTVDLWLDKLDHLIATNNSHTAWTARRIP